MLKGKRYNSIILLLIMLVGCSSHLPLLVDSSTGYYPSKRKLTDDEIIKSIKTSGLPEFVFLNLRHNHVSFGDRVGKQRESLISDAFTNLGFPIINNKYLRTMLEDTLPEESVYDIDDIVMLNKLSMIVGRFLIAEVTSDYSPPEIHYFRVTIVDPYIGKILFIAENRTKVWGSFQKELYYPVLNEVKTWIDKQDFSGSPNERLDNAI